MTLTCHVYLNQSTSTQCITPDLLQLRANQPVSDLQPTLLRLARPPSSSTIHINPPTTSLHPSLPSTTHHTKMAPTTRQSQNPPASKHTQANQRSSKDPQSNRSSPRKVTYVTTYDTRSAVTYLQHPFALSTEPSCHPARKDIRHGTPQGFRDTQTWARKRCT
jgi:hypothetical protein